MRRFANREAASSDGEPPWAVLGTFVFHDIVHGANIYQSTGNISEIFPLNHMDLGTPNILVDDDFNFLAVID
jgi:hypothetical protein